MSVCYVCADSYGGQKREWDSLELAGVSGSCELPDMDAGNQTLVPCKNTTQLMNHLSSPHTHNLKSLGIIFLFEF